MNGIVASSLGLTEAEVMTSLIVALRSEKNAS
jgi:hypothetical protein